MSYRPHAIGPRGDAASRAGFTIIELLTVIAIIAILMALVVSTGRYAKRASMEARAKADMERIATKLDEYFINHGEYPEDFGTEGFGTEIATHVGDEIGDPWGRPYVYTESGTTYSLYSLGSNPDLGEDDIKHGE